MPSSCLHAHVASSLATVVGCVARDAAARDCLTLARRNTQSPETGHRLAMLAPVKLPSLTFLAKRLPSARSLCDSLAAWSPLAPSGQDPPWLQRTQCNVTVFAPKLLTIRPSFGSLLPCCCSRKSFDFNAFRLGLHQCCRLRCGPFHGRSSSS